MGYGLLNLGSLLLGLVAWILPIAYLVKINTVKYKNWNVLSFISISSCVSSLFLQIIYQNYLVKKEDWSAIADTSGGLVLVSAVLIIVTITLNVITLAVYYKNSRKLSKMSCPSAENIY